MKVISVVNQKGGCGKTITSTSLSAALSKRGHKVLLIDLDPQAHATFALRKENALPITGILEAVSRNTELAWADTYCSVNDNFYFIGAGIGLASLEQTLANHEDKLRILSLFIDKIASEFDYCILDCPPSLGVLTLNGLCASQYSIVPVSVCDFSVRGLEILKNIMIMLKEHSGSHPIPFYLLTMVDKRYRFCDEFTKRVKKQLGNLLLNTVIRTNIHLREAASSGKTIFQYKPDSRGAEDFAALAQELEKLTAQRTWTSLILKGKPLSEVYVVGDFTNWEKNEKYKLHKIGEDTWSINIPLEKGTYRYKFVEKDNWFVDPFNKVTENDPFGGKNSLLSVE